MAPENLDSTIGNGEPGLDPGLDAAIGAAEDMVGTVGTDGLDLEEVLNADTPESDDAGPRRYDFNRPHNISRSFEKNLQAIGETFAKTATIDFTSLMRATTTVEFRGLRQITFAEYQDEMPNPTAAAMVGLEPLKGQILLHLDLGLSFIFMQKLMGGAIDAQGTSREFTEIERGVNAGLVERYTEILRRSMSKWVEVTPAFGKLENNPGYLSGIAEGEMLIILRFRLQVGTSEGMAELGFPLSAFGPVREIFDPRDTIELRTEHELRDDRRRILGMVEATSSEIVVELGKIDSNLEEILNLREGEILRLPQAVDAPLRVSVEGQDTWLGEAGRIGQQRAVKLVRKMNKE